MPGSPGTSSAPSAADAPIWRRTDVCSTRLSPGTRAAPPPTVVVDTGPIIALLDADEAHHDWVGGQFETLAPPLLTCEAALAIGRLIRRYGDVPMSFADACLVRLVERTEHASIMTLGSDFHIYRQTRRRVIPLLAPA